jgi:hypothetical protein
VKTKKHKEEKMKKLNDAAIARLYLHDRSNRPVQIIAGNQPPKFTGESGYFCTNGGQRIYHPSAYRRKGFSNMFYCHSTLKIEVGKQWLSRYRRGLKPYKAWFISGWFLPREKVKKHGITSQLVYTWDFYYYVVRAKGQLTYHFSGTIGNHAVAMMQALRHWRAQAKSKILAQQCIERLAKPERIWVGAEHAEAAGFCKAGIERFCADKSLEITAWHRGDLLLEKSPHDSRLTQVLAKGFMK